MASSKEAAMAVGKRLEKQRGADNAINAHLCRAMTLDDQQLTAATALVRGNATIRSNQYELLLEHRPIQYYSSILTARGSQSRPSRASCQCPEVASAHSARGVGARPLCRGRAQFRPRRKTPSF